MDFPADRSSRATKVVVLASGWSKVKPLSCCGDNCEEEEEEEEAGTSEETVGSGSLTFVTSGFVVCPPRSSVAERAAPEVAQSPPPTPEVPCIFIMCVFRKYLLQSAFEHMSHVTLAPLLPDDDDESLTLL